MKILFNKFSDRDFASMKLFLILSALYLFLAIGCAHSPNYTVSSAEPADALKLKVVLASAASEQVVTAPTEKSGKVKSSDDPYEDDYLDDNADEERAVMADPIEPFNRVMYHFNDKLYFWALKPVAQGYKFVVPEVARVSVKNFFSNLRFPTRFVSCLLQADLSGAATEFGRFTINTVWGIGGLMDPSSGKELNLQKQNTDLGQTLGFYGVGHGFYIVWPILGPSSPRDSTDIVGDYFLYPVSYLKPFYVPFAVKAYEEVNSTSLRIGDYESLKDAAIDPYVAIRDAYAQYRMKKVKERRLKFELFWLKEAKAASSEQNAEKE
jgi:phospholipid-binding lipoprotein MlaA